MRDVKERYLLLNAAFTGRGRSVPAIEFSMPVYMHPQVSVWVGVNPSALSFGSVYKFTFLPFRRSLFHVCQLVSGSFPRSAVCIMSCHTCRICCVVLGTWRSIPKNPVIQYCPTIRILRCSKQDNSFRIPIYIRAFCKQPCSKCSTQFRICLYEKLEWCEVAGERFFLGMPGWWRAMAYVGWTAEF